MRGFYKVLASVGMLALSTAAALGVRHLTIASKKRKEAQKAAEPSQPEESPIHKTDEDAAQEATQSAVGKAVETVIDNAKKVVDNIGNVVDDVVNKVEQVADEVTDKAEKAADNAEKTAENIADHIEDVVEADVEIRDDKQE